MTAEDRIKMVIGNLVAEKCILEAQIEKLKAEIEKLKAPPPSE